MPLIITSATGVLKLLYPFPTVRDLEIREEWKLQLHKLYKKKTSKPIWQKGITPWGIEVMTQFLLYIILIRYLLLAIWLLLSIMF